MEPYEDLNSLCQRIENERFKEGFTEFAAIKGKKAGTIKSVREYADLSHVIFQEKKRSWSPDRERWVLWSKDPGNLSHEAALIELAKIKGHLDEYLYVPFNDEAFVKD